MKWLLLLLTLPLPAAAALNPFTSPPKGQLGVSFLSRPEVNDARIAYGIGERHTLSLHGIRNHWPQKTELHYALLRLDAKIFGGLDGDNDWAVWMIAGGGLANKLKGVDRMASLVGLESEVNSGAAHFALRALTLGAKDFDRKDFVRARAGFLPYRANNPAEPNALFFLQAQYESYATHRIEWGPAVRFQLRNVALELYGNFKGNYSFAFAFHY